MPAHDDRDVPHHAPEADQRQPRGIPVADPMIPGERDPSNLTHREPGAVSGQFAGADIPPDSVPWVDDETRLELIREGGGHDAEHRLREKNKKREGRRDR